MENSKEKIVAGKENLMKVPVDVTVRGKKYAGTFLIRYPSVDDSIRVGTEASRIRLGVPPDSLDNITNTLIRAMAVITVLASESPEWAQKPLELPEDVLLNFFNSYIDQKTFFREENPRGGEGNS